MILRRGRWVGAGVALALASAAMSVAAYRVPRFGFDEACTRAVQATNFGVLAAPLHFLNALGFPPLADVVYGGVLVALFVCALRWEAVVGVVGLGGSAAVSYTVKFLVHRPRPGGPGIRVDHLVPNPSYPAGHVLDFTAFAGYLCFLVMLLCPVPWLRRSLIAGLVALIALMAVARIDSGEHWASDVLGGYLLGGMCLVATVLFYAWGGSRARAWPWWLNPRSRSAATAGGRRAGAGGD